MSVINVLSPLVADMIAAGEVVERPASVVKELLENAVDAGAKNISVEIRGGGCELIRVTDDGCGMTPDDAGNCFLRHATSKLRDAEGLAAIGTLGFRGEALAAISAVSRVTLTTRPKGADVGTQVVVAGGEIEELAPCGCPEGTSFSVADLFYNTPARLKFMKSDRAEGSACVSLALRVALGHPEVSIRCVHDGKEDFFTAGDGRAQSAVYSLLGRDMAGSMLACSGGSAGVDVTGYVSSPRSGRGNRAMQFFFVNGRAIRSLTMQAALEQAYKNTLLTGRFPACALYITLSPGQVDVNVHPTKNEVKFTREGEIFEAVYHSVRAALESERETAQISLSRSTEKKLDPPAHTAQLLHRPAPPSAQTRTWVQPTVEKTPAVPPLFKTSIPPVRESGGPTLAVHTPKSVYATRTQPPQPMAPQPEPTPAPPTKSAPEAPRAAPEKTWRVVGEVMDTYIVVDLPEQMLLIDKHAAHERINFNRLKAAQTPVMAQGLLVPLTWHAGVEGRELAEKNAALLSSLGFELEPFGEEDMVIRALPADMDASEGPAALEEICESLSRGGADLARDKILQTIACKAAIKAGRRSELRELEALAARVISGEIRYCPHGRPVATVITKNELDKKFKRIV